MDFRTRIPQVTAAFSLDLHGDKKTAFEFLQNIHLARNDVFLGSVESLACRLKTTTHAGYTEDECIPAGVTDGLVRVSVVIQNWRDLLAEIEQSMDIA